MTESAGKEGLIMLVKEEVCARPTRMGQSFNNFRTRLWKKGFLGGGTSWAKAGEIWKCGRKMGNSLESGLTGGGVYGSNIRSRKRKKGENQVGAQASDKEM